MKLPSSINLGVTDFEFRVPIIRQPEQPSFDLANPVNYLSEGLSSLAIYFCVATLFFSIGIEFGRRHKRYQKPIATQKQHVESLERIWQMTAKRKD